MLRSNEHFYDVKQYLRYKRLLYLCVQVIEYLLCGRSCIRVYNLKDGSRRLQPHAQGAGVFAKNSAFSHLIRRLGPVKEVVA